MHTNRHLFLEHVAQTSDTPLMLEIESAEGIYMYGKDQKAYIDLISGIGVSGVGHKNPAVIKAIHEQTDQYLHLMVYGEFVQSPQVKLAKALSDTLPPTLNAVYFLNSGSEAVEGALKLAKRFTGKSEIVSFTNAYHGSSHGALSVTGSEDLKRPFRPLLPGIKHLHYGNEEQLDQINDHTAAVIIETVQGEAGVISTTKSFFQALRNRCTETGTLLILDEIQTGFGRTGKFWGFEHYGITPDIIVSAKGMGGGMPIGAFISSQEILGVFKNNPVLGHISTFGGHPVSAAASLATLNYVQENRLVDQVEAKAQLFHQKLVHPKISEIRNKGLMMAAQFESYEVVKPIIDKAIELGVLTDWFLFCDNAMRIAPPLIIRPDEIEKACHLILEAIDTAD